MFKNARKPHKEWNRLDIIVQDGAITAILHGTKITESEPYEWKAGQIGFQTEGAPIDVRNLRISTATVDLMPCNNFESFCLLCLPRSHA